MRSLATRVVLALLVAGTIALDAASASHAAPGDLDQMFSDDGRLTRAGSLADIVVQPDGAIVVATFVAPPDSPGTSRLEIARLTPAGSPDRSFGADGKVTVLPGALRAQLAIEPDGTILVVAETGNELQGVSISLRRLRPDGRPDPALDQITIAGSIPNASEQLGPTLVQPDGRIVIVGKANSRAFVARLLADGTPDPSWADGGQLILDKYSFGAIAITADSDLVLAGGTDGPDAYEPSDLAVVRARADGTLDPSFAGGGVFVRDLGSFDAAGAVAVRPDGGLVVGGTLCPLAGCAPRDFRGLVLGLRPDGTLDPAFSGDGLLVDRALGGALSIAPDGTILSIGERRTSGFADRTSWSRDSTQMALPTRPSGATAAPRWISTSARTCSGRLRSRRTASSWSQAASPAHRRQVATASPVSRSRPVSPTPTPTRSAMTAIDARAASRPGAMAVLVWIEP